MKKSRFFDELSSLYTAEIADMQQDSEGKNVLKERLVEKRTLFPELLFFIDENVEMAAVAFHQGITFPYPKIMETLVAYEPEKFPSWDKLSQAVVFSEEVQPLVDLALRVANGERFLIVTIALEYLLLHDNPDSTEYVDDGGVSDDEEGDLGEDGDDFLASQGFDRIPT